MTTEEKKQKIIERIIEHSRGIVSSARMLLLDPDAEDCRTDREQDVMYHAEHLADALSSYDAMHNPPKRVQ